MKTQSTQAIDNSVSDFPKELSKDDFQWFRNFVNEQTGIYLADDKQPLVYTRLSRRLRELNLNCFSDYREYLQKGDSQELINFTNAVTTNLTSFFREKHHFDLLEKNIIPELLERNRKSRRLRIWSAGCSSGMEAYSIAIILARLEYYLYTWDVRILATDLDSAMLATGIKGMYREKDISMLNAEEKQQYFLQGKGNNSGFVRVKSELREKVVFNNLNLMSTWPINGRIDIIFCRNVIIYFNKETQYKLIKRFKNVQQPSDYLIMGHSENLTKINDDYKLVEKSTYQLK